MKKELSGIVTELGAGYGFWVAGYMKPNCIYVLATSSKHANNFLTVRHGESKGGGVGVALDSSNFMYVVVTGLKLE